MGFIKVLDDGHGLGQARAIVQLQQRHQTIGSDVGIGRLPVLALGQVHRHVVIADALERQRDAHAERGRGAEVVVELHGASISAMSEATQPCGHCGHDAHRIAFVGNAVGAPDAANACVTDQHHCAVCEQRVGHRHVDRRRAGRTQQAAARARVWPELATSSSSTTARPCTGQCGQLDVDLAVAVAGLAAHAMRPTVPAAACATHCSDSSSGPISSTSAAH
jgi:hypothetical protein